MKKLILFLIIAISFVSVNAQTNVNFPKNDYYFQSYTGVAADTIGVGQTTWNKAYCLFVPQSVLYNVKVKVEEVTSDFKATVALQGKIHASDSYSTITTYTYTGTGADTTLVFSQPATKQVYRYFNLLVTRRSGKGKISYASESYKF